MEQQPHPTRTATVEHHPPASSPGPRRGRADQGQVVPLMAGLLALVAVVLVGLVVLGNMLTDRARAQSAADAAALAGAARGEDVAASVARENRADLESFAVKGAEVEVTVRAGDARATARARREW